MSKVKTVKHTDGQLDHYIRTGLSSWTNTKGKKLDILCENLIKCLNIDTLQELNAEIAGIMRNIKENGSNYISNLYLLFDLHEVLEYSVIEQTDDIESVVRSFECFKNKDFFKVALSNNFPSQKIVKIKRTKRFLTWQLCQFLMNIEFITPGISVFFFGSIEKTAEQFIQYVITIKAWEPTVDINKFNIWIQDYCDQHRRNIENIRK